MINAEIDKFLQEEENDTCKGQIYKCEQSFFLDKRERYVEKVRMVPMKKLSCPGCKNCGGIIDAYSEFAYDHGIDIRPAIFHNEFYILDIVDKSRDWKTGIVDDFGMAFIFIEGVEL